MIKITKAGWIYIVLTIFLGFSAINTNNNLVFIVVSFMLAVMGISGFLGKANLDGLHFLIVDNGELFAEEIGSLNLFVKNNKRFLPSVLLNIELSGSSSKVIYLGNISNLDINFRITPKIRGINKICEIIVSSPFPFNFFVRYKRYRSDDTFIVFPKPAEFIYDKNFHKDEGEDTGSQTITHKLEELSNIRGYSNDPSRRIFWKQFAKTGNLYTKEYTGDDGKTIFVDFDDIKNIYPIEEALSVATKIVLIAYENSVRLIFSLNGKTYPPMVSNQIKRELFKELALYGKS
ncbi:MAG: DUF58 domain-containing protein [Calditerrivibrio sp.]|nr:DUF58 domain-containing protein [Calditerrivibrio sp.]